MRSVEKRLREKIKWLEKDREDIQADRQKFRNFCSQKMRQYIEIHGKGNSILTSWLIEDMAKHFQQVSWFHW